MKNKFRIVFELVLLALSILNLSGCSFFGAHTVRPYEGEAHTVRPYVDWAHIVRQYEGEAHTVRPYDVGANYVSAKEKNGSKVSSYELGKGLHIIRNPENYTQVVFDENSNVIDRTINTDLESIALIENPLTGSAKYYYKADFTAEVKKADNSSTEDSDISLDGLIPIQKSKLYDKSGNEIKLPIDFSNSELELNDMIFIRDADKSYYENNLEIVHIDESNSKIDLEHAYENNVKYKIYKDENGNDDIYLYFSSGLYDESGRSDRVVITDSKLNIIKEIEGYILDYIVDLQGKKIVQLIKLENDKIKYNFLDDKNNLVFEKDLDKGIPYDNETRIVTLVRGDKELDFNFDTFTMVGEERDYVEKETGDPIYLYKEKFDDIRSKIVESDKKYIWGTTWYDRVNKKIRILAYYNEVFDELTGYKEDADVYDEEGKLLGTMPKFGACYEETGYFFYNNNTVCDFDLNIIKTFNDEMYLSEVEKFDKIFFIERYDITDQYEDKKIPEIKPFKIYDKDFNILYDNIIKVYEYTMDDYLIVVDKDTTKFVASDNTGNLYVKKEIDRVLDVSNWYSESDKKAFKDLKTELFGILDKDLNIIIDGFKNIIDLKKDYFTYELGFSFGLMDYNGNAINKFLIFNTMGE